MIVLLSFLGVLAVLVTEGWLAVGLLFRAPSDRLLHLTLALPTAAFINVFVFFGLTVVQLPITLPFVALGHALAMITIVLLRFLLPVPQQLPAPLHHHLTVPLPLRVLCLFLLGSTAVYAFAHSVLLPTYQYDSLTNWIMRSKASFFAHHILFENAPPFGAIRKPFYPFLLHALHIVGNIGLPTWHDAVATGMAFALSMTLLASSFLLLRRAAGASTALVTLTVIVGIPLFGVHLGEGYADHLLASMALLSLAAYAVFLAERSASFLVVSAIAASMAVWVKDEGMAFVLVPWLVLLGCSCVFRPKLRWRSVRVPALLALLLSSPWPIFLLLRGYALTPHGASDAAFGYQPGTLAAIASVLLGGGSFGAFWPLLAVAIVLLLIARRSAAPAASRFLPLLLPGALCFAIVSSIYLFTPNAVYLLNGEAFDRQLLTPAVLLAAAVILSISSFYTSPLSKD